MVYNFVGRGSARVVFTVKMVTAVGAEKLETFRNIMRPKSQSRNYVLVTD
jgi:hypothetical protein